MTATVDDGREVHAHVDFGHGDELMTFERCQELYGGMALWWWNYFLNGHDGDPCDASEDICHGDEACEAVRAVYCGQRNDADVTMADAASIIEEAKFEVAKQILREVRRALLGEGADDGDAEDVDEFDEGRYDRPPDGEGAMGDEAGDEILARHEGARGFGGEEDDADEDENASRKEGGKR